jgi:hypothetical protein
VVGPWRSLPLMTRQAQAPGSATFHVEHPERSAGHLTDLQNQRTHHVYCSSYQRLSETPALREPALLRQVLAVLSHARSQGLCAAGPAHCTRCDRTLHGTDGRVTFTAAHALPPGYGQAAAVGEPPPTTLDPPSTLAPAPAATGGRACRRSGWTWSQEHVTATVTAALHDRLLAQPSAGEGRYVPRGTFTGHGCGRLPAGGRHLTRRTHPIVFCNPGTVA